MDIPFNPALTRPAYACTLAISAEKELAARALEPVGGTDRKALRTLQVIPKNAP
jgi:hypothetical protein